MNTPNRSRMWVLAGIVLLCAGLAAYLFWKRPGTPVGRPATIPKAAVQTPEKSLPPPNKAPEFPELESFEPRLQMGVSSALPGLVISVPLEFTTGVNEPIGRIHAELTVPKGPWKFERAKPPDEFDWKVTARRNRAKEEQAAAGGTVIELDISAGGEVIQDGVVASLAFSLLESQASSHIPVSIARLVTSPPENENAGAEEPMAPQELSATPDEAVPAVACFFFTH